MINHNSAGPVALANQSQLALKDVPVKIILNDDCGLIGAARYTLVQKAFGTST